MLYIYTFYSHYNTDWIANTETVLDPNNSVIKRLWCTMNVSHLGNMTLIIYKHFPIEVLHINLALTGQAVTYIIMKTCRCNIQRFLNL